MKPLPFSWIWLSPRKSSCFGFRTCAWSVPSKIVKKNKSAIYRSQFISHWTLEFFIVRSLWNLCRFREFGWDRENLVASCSVLEKRIWKISKGDWSATYRSQFISHWTLVFFLLSVVYETSAVFVNLVETEKI